MWKSDDKCKFYECSANPLNDDIVEAKIISYQKSCAKVINCPSKRIVMKDCCLQCEYDQSLSIESNLDDFVHSADKYTEIMSRELYLKHPCRRECIDGLPAKVCNYTFIVSILHSSQRRKISRSDKCLY